MLKRQRVLTTDHLLLSDSETISNDSKELVHPVEICVDKEICSKITVGVDADKKDSNHNRRFKEMVTKAKEYQAKMNEISIPSYGGKSEQATIVPILTWKGVGRSLRQKYEQPLHYLTHKILKEWDSWKTTPLDESIEANDAESVVWGIEQVHRKCASPNYLANLWLADPSYLELIDLA